MLYKLEDNIMIENFSNAFDKIGKQWMLITASDGEKVNAMTASWGGLGVIWGKKVAYIFVRESRYTKEFIDKNDTLSLAFFSEDKKSMLGYMGKTSGRDEDKIAKAGLNVYMKDGIPVFKEAESTLLCKKLYAGAISPSDFVDDSIDATWYSDKDYHTMYIVEILDVV